MTHENLMRFANAYAEGLSDGLSNNSTELDRENDELIRRQDAIDAVYKIVERNLDSSVFEDGLAENPHIDVIVDELENLPSAEPEIIYCKYCRKHNQGINEEPYLTDRCPLILHRGYAQGHEFDYQYCAYAERRTDG